MNNATGLRSTKSFYNFPCAHRQWRHNGHCAYVHGYSRSFHFEFTTNMLDPVGFVLDFGSLRKLQTHLEFMFDHTLLLNSDDPLLDEFRALEKQGACALRIMDSVSMEGTALYLHKWLSEFFAQNSDTAFRGVQCVRIEVRENDKNSAVYEVSK